MKKFNSLDQGKVILLMLLGALLVLVLFFGSIILQTWRELDHFEARAARLEARLEQAEKEFIQKETYHSRLMQDPEFLERVARERLGFTKPDEVIFRFTPE